MILKTIVPARTWAACCQKPEELSWCHKTRGPSTHLHAASPAAVPHMLPWTLPHKRRLGASLHLGHVCLETSPATSKPHLQLRASVYTRARRAATTPSNDVTITQLLPATGRASSSANLHWKKHTIRIGTFALADVSVLLAQLACPV